MGDCYEANGKYFFDNLYNTTGAVLVHGEVQGQGPLSNITFGHCWIEIDSVVLDFSNGQRRAIDKEKYYLAGDIEDIDNYRKYDYTEFLEKINEYQHWGPWDIETEY